MTNGRAVGSGKHEPPVEVDTDAAAATRRARARAAKSGPTEREEITAVWVGSVDDPELAEFKAEVGHRR